MKSNKTNINNSNDYEKKLRYVDVTKRVKESKRREIKKTYTIDDSVSRNVNTNKPFLERILSYKEYIPLISILFTGALTIFKAFIIRG